MPEYRLYVFDGAGVLHMPHEFEAANDTVAIEWAKSREFENCQMELWQKNRKICCWGFPNCAFQECASREQTLQPRA